MLIEMQASGGTEPKTRGVNLLVKLELQAVAHRRRALAQPLRRPHRLLRSDRLTAQTLHPTPYTLHPNKAPSRSDTLTASCAQTASPLRP